MTALPPGALNWYESKRIQLHSNPSWRTDKKFEPLDML
jgi:hypothetical protein